MDVNEWIITVNIIKTITVISVTSTMVTRVNSTTWQRAFLKAIAQ